jgi:hypothetical protein
MVPAVVLVAVVTGCGSEGSYQNRPRPPAPITVTAAILDDEVLVSPDRFGAGPIQLIVSNQSAEPQTVTFETDELAGESGGIRSSTRAIPPARTGTLQIDPRQGTYRVSAGDGIEPASVEVGEQRKSAQNELLQP